MELAKIDTTKFVNLSGDYRPIRFEKFSDDLKEAIEDSRQRKNLHGPFDSAEDAVASMLED